MISLTPISSKAKNRLANILNNNPLVIVEQVKGTRLFCVNADRSWCSWIDSINDPHWKIVL